MKEINVSLVRDAVAELCIKANKCLPDDIVSTIEKAQGSEKNPLAKEILNDICKNCAHLSGHRHGCGFS